ncbi:MAG TPA: glycosyltransferase family 4 protein [Vicinamibacterales bacterium]|nr:glycosyltransferase family 4 protein [Vicinamibacterales bacterium]
MRICHVAPELLPVPPDKGGAIERWIRDGSRQLAARGHDVHVVSRDHGDGVRERELDGVTYHFVRIPPAIDRGQAGVLLRGPWYFMRAAAVVARLKPEIVHHHSRPSGLYCIHLRTPRARHVLSLHSMRYGWPCAYAGADRAVFDAAFRVCARVLSVSEFIRRHVLDAYPRVAGKLATLYNGVDGTLFHPDGGRDQAADRIVYVGRIEERKGVHVLLDAFERVLAVRPLARLRLVGPHSYWAAAPSAFYAGLVERVRRSVFIELCDPTYVDEELAAIYRSATVTVVPSVFPEALGLTSLEAQASGVPVVVSDAGGLPETVLDGESGLVVARSDAAALASAILALLGDASRLTGMGQRAREWAMAQFSWVRIAAQLDAIYGEVV